MRRGRRGKVIFFPEALPNGERKEVQNVKIPKVQIAYSKKKGGEKE
jgi:hypothetical protein